MYLINVLIDCSSNLTRTIIYIAKHSFGEHNYVRGIISDITVAFSWQNWGKSPLKHLKQNNQSDQGVNSYLFPNINLKFTCEFFHIQFQLKVKPAPFFLVHLYMTYCAKRKKSVIIHFSARVFHSRICLIEKLISCNPMDFVPSHRE